jgi:hypothetical protein
VVGGGRIEHAEAGEPPALADGVRRALPGPGEVTGEHLGLLAGRRDDGRGCRPELVDRAADPGQAEAVEDGVGGRVVAHRHHEERQIAQRQLGLVLHRAQPGPPAGPLRGDRHPLVEAELPGVGGALGATPTRAA